MFEQLYDLEGLWQGKGHGGFPTIESFRYREELTFTVDTVAQHIHYQQKTWRIVDDATQVPSHWETGFLRQLENGQIELSNTQSGGRVEVLVGSLAQEEDALALSLSNTHLGNDLRMRLSSRQLRIYGDKLSYSMGMATTKIGSMTQHLAAELFRT